MLFAVSLHLIGHWVEKWLSLSFTRLDGNQGFLNFLQQILSQTPSISRIFHLQLVCYQGYHRLPENIRVVSCWAHARRKSDEALNALPPDKREGMAALTGLEYCNKLFA